MNSITLPVTQHIFQNTQVFFQSNAFVNANSMASGFNKKPENYLRTNRTKEYIEALKKALFPVALKSATKQNQLVIINQGGKPEEQGTWLHPKLAIDFARWLNPDFAVWCDMQIEKILHPAPIALVQLTPLSPAQKNHIQNEVKRLVNAQVGTTYRSMWSTIKDHFKVGTYKEIPAARYVELCEFLKCEPIEGELLPAIDLPSVPEGKDYQAAMILIKRLRGFAGFAVPSSMLNEMNSDLDKLDKCLVSAFTECDEALLHIGHAQSFLKRWRGSK